MLLSRRRFVGAAAATLVAAPAIAQAPRIVDALGREVPLAKPAQRVIPAFNYEEFTAIAGVDGWRHVVGMNRVVWEGWRPAIFQRYVPAIPALAALPDIGNTDEGTFAAEKVISLRPDLLIVPAWFWNAAPTARAQLDAAGIPVMVIDYNAQTLEGHTASTRAIGAAMASPERADALIERYRRNHGAITERVARAAGGAKPRLHLELGQGGADVVGNSYPPTNLWGRIFNLLGADNIAAGKVTGGFAPLPAEAVLAADPQFVFIGASSWVNRPNAVKTGYDVPPEVTRASLAPYARRPGWAALSALRNGELHALEHGLCRTLFDDTVMLYIAKRLYPGAFENADPIAELAAYHAKYLPIAFSGTWMLRFQA